MQSKYDQPRNILVSTLKRLYDMGMTTTSGGNLSIKDDEGNIWITPSGIDKGTLRPDDVMKVSPDGTITGLHRPSCELPFHRSVYALRPDVKAVLHAHSPAMVAFSLVGRVPDTSLIPGCAALCGKTAFAKYEIPGSEKLGKIISAEFANGADSVIMENHGAVMCGKTIAEAFARFEALDYVARIQINAVAMGKLNPVSGELPAVKRPEFTPESILPNECELREKICAFAVRSYRLNIFYSGSSFIAARLGDDDFVITPAGFDALYLDLDDMVRVRGGKVQAGKVPPVDVDTVRGIFNRHAGVNAVMMTRSPNAMAFANAGKAMDSRMIPESYINLRDIPLISQADYLRNPAIASETISATKPVVMVESHGMFTTGKNLTEAFDRMEVGEFTAKCILLAERIGKITPINQQQVDEIISDFKLPVEA